MAVKKDVLVLVVQYNEVDPIWPVVRADLNTRNPAIAGFICLPGEAGKPGSLQEGCITPTGGKIIRMARALLANGRV